MVVVTMKESSGGRGSGGCGNGALGDGMTSMTMLSVIVATRSGCGGDDSEGDCGCDGGD